MNISEIDVYAVTIDGEEVFPALMLPGAWNGFCNPAFTRDTVEDIADFFRASYARPVAGVMTIPAGVSVTYDAVNDAYVFATPDDYEGVPEVFAGVEIAGEVFYPIGAGAWAWQKMEEEAYEAIQLFSELYEAIGRLQVWRDEAEFKAVN